MANFEQAGSIARAAPKTQSDDQPETQRYVRIAVLPYSVLKAPDSARLPSGGSGIYGLGSGDGPNPMAGFVRNPTGFWSKTFKSSSRRSSTEEEDQHARRPSFWEKTGLVMPKTTTKDPSKPPFVLREVTYETWRAHYAKDKDGNYMGTDTPAEDCLLLPHDLAKWRPGAPTSHRDLFTRGDAALPVYKAEPGGDHLPEYQPAPTDGTAVVDDEAKVVSHLGHGDTKH